MQLRQHSHCRQVALTFFAHMWPTSIFFRTVNSTNPNLLKSEPGHFHMWSKIKYMHDVFQCNLRLNGHWTSSAFSIIEIRQTSQFSAGGSSFILNFLLLSLGHKLVWIAQLQNRYTNANMSSIYIYFINKVCCVWHHAFFAHEGHYSAVDCSQLSLSVVAFKLYSWDDM